MEECEDTRTVFLFIGMMLLCTLMLVSCTISFQNIDTHGTATDLVDETISPTTEVKPNINLPITPI